MQWNYDIRITTPAGSIYASEIDMDLCLQNVGVDKDAITGIGSYTGNINTQQIKSNRIAVTGSGGFIGYNQNGYPIVEVKNQVIFDMTPPSNMTGAIQQTSVQVVTKNLQTGKKHIYNPPEQHFNPEQKGNIEITNLEKKDFIDASYCNPNIKINARFELFGFRLCRPLH